MRSSRHRLEASWAAAGDVIDFAARLKRIGTARAVALAAAALVVAACGGPLGPIAGGELSGASAEPPARWRSVPEAIALEVRPDEPYSVNLWSVAVGPFLYVATGDEDSAWADYLRGNGNVRVRIDGKVYMLRATAVDDAEERQRVAAAYMRKYAGEAEQDGEGWAPVRKRRENAMREALDNISGSIFRLSPR